MPRDDRSRREDRALGHARDRVHTLEAVTCERILEFIDDDLDLDPFAESPVDRGDEGIARAWAAYDAGHLDSFVERLGPSLSTAQRMWVKAQRHVEIGLWAVRDIHPGWGLLLENRLTGAEVAVFERLWSRHGPIHRHFFARIVRFEGEAFLSGTLMPAIAPEDAEGVLNRLRTRLHDQAELPQSGLLNPAWLKHREVQHLFWRSSREAMYRPRRMAA